jgi:hypothetical protein
MFANCVVIDLALSVYENLKLLLVQYTDLCHGLAKWSTQDSLDIWIHASGDDNQDEKS